MESFTAIEKINSTQNLSVKDFEDGNINLSDVMEEVNYLKKQITIIRQEMAAFLTGIASMETLKPQQIFEENTQRAISLQRTLDDYTERYKKLIPLLELVNQDLNLKIPPKQESQIKPPTAPTSTSNTPNTGPSNNNGPAPKKAPQRKRTYTKKNQSNVAPAQTPNTHSNTPILPNTNNGGSYQAGSVIGFQPFQGNNNGTTDGNGSENQPILL